MTPKELRKARLLTGLSGSAFADLIGIDGKTEQSKNYVSQMEKGSRPIPDGVAMRLANEGLYAAPYPDLFAIGDSPDGEGEYLIRLAAPRFTARIGSDDLFPGGLCYSVGNGEILYDVLWLDTPPREISGQTTSNRRRMRSTATRRLGWTSNKIIAVFSSYSPAASAAGLSHVS